MSHEGRLRGTGFKRLFRGVRQRLEREPGAIAHGRTVLKAPTSEERAAIGGLLARRFGGKTVPVALAVLDAELREGTGRGLIGWLERLGGPLRNRPDEAARREAMLEAAIAELEARSFSGAAWFGPWVAALRRGTLARLHAAEALGDLRVVADVLEALPADRAAMPVFASLYAGGTKALRETRLEGIVLGALATWAGVAKPGSAGERRALWERFGVFLDDLSTSVLVLNLRAVGDGLVDRHLRAFAEAGVPVRLTLHQLVIAPPTLDHDSMVFICENPAIVRMAAERLGAKSAALVATEGQPSSAFWRLMACCEATNLRARADFDEAGLQIGGRIIRELGAKPWRFDAESYEEAVATNAPLPTELPDTPWDPRLAKAMAGRVRVEEEELLDALIGDLAAG